MKIFVTGGTGFVGSNFLRRVIGAGHTVIAQRRPGSLSRVTLPVEPFWIDRPLDDNFSEELIGCNALVHFAAHTPNPPYAPIQECIYWNVYATINLIQQAAAAGIKDVLVAGTCFEYGAAAEGLEFVHPKTEMRPTETYPISKAAATTACLGLARNLGLRLKILRIFQVYGDGESPSRFWPSLRKAAYEGQDFQMSAGKQVRDFISVDDVSDEFVRALDFSLVEPGYPHILNVGTGRAQSLLEFAEYWWGEWNAKGTLIPGMINLRRGELMRLVADVESTFVS